jgi:predicted Zn-dependent protease
VRFLVLTLRLAITVNLGNILRIAGVVAIVSKILHISSIAKERETLGLLKRVIYSKMRLAPS